MSGSAHGHPVPAPPPQREALFGEPQLGELPDTAELLAQAQESPLEERADILGHIYHQLAQSLDVADTWGAGAAATERQ